MKHVELIVAATKDGVIGVDNKTPWFYRGDLKRFREKTVGHTVVMGRKTYESIGRPLPERHNIVVSRRNPKIDGDGLTKLDVVASVSEAISRASTPKIFIIGGGEIYKLSLIIGIVDVVDLTIVPADISPDTPNVVMFPMDMLNDFETSRHMGHPYAGKEGVSLSIFDRTKKS